MCGKLATEEGGKHVPPPCPTAPTVYEKNPSGPPAMGGGGAVWREISDELKVLCYIRVTNRVTGWSWIHRKQTREGGKSSRAQGKVGLASTNPVSEGRGTKKEGLKGSTSLIGTQ